MRFTLDTVASPEQVLRAFTDFSDHRLQVWKRTLDPRRYEVRDQGDTWAVAREASPGSPFWVICHYDWSQPGEVRWDVVESSYGGGGSGVIRIEPLEGGGSRLHADWDATGGRRGQRALIFLLYNGPMPRLLPRVWRRVLDHYAASDAA